MKMKLFIAAANGKKDDVESMLVSGGFDLNFPGPGGMTPLHAATKFKHSGVVSLLLQHGADPTIKDQLGETAMSLPRISLTQEVWDLLHPEEATKSTQVQIKIDTYRDTHLFDISKEALLLLGKQYRDTEQVDHLTKTDVIQYMVSAIEYMTLDLLESSKDSTAKGIGEAMQMLDTLSACAFVIKTKYTDIVGKLPNIAWEDLALYARHQQYNPNFLSSLNSSTKYELVEHALYSMLQSGELERIIATMDTMSPNGNDLRKMNTLLGFVNDEYNAQYIESALQNCADNSVLTSESGKARLLMSIVEIGEALNNSSAKLQSLFTASIMDQLSIMRNAIAHPERVGNREAIKDFISHTTPVVINGIAIDLAQLYYDLMQSYAAVQDFLKLYDTSKRSDNLWQEVEGCIDDYVITKKHKMPTSHHDSVLTDISKQYTVQLAEVVQRFIDDKKLLDQTIIQQFQDRQFKDKVEVKLKNSTKTLNDTNEALQRYKAEYDSAKIIPEDTRTPEQKKLVIDYENTVQKYDLWSNYNHQLQQLEQSKQVQIDQLEQGKHHDIEVFAVKLLDDFIMYSSKIQSLFTKLSDFTHVEMTANGIPSRDFSTHQDHPLLAFYQIILGSLARTLLSIDSFKSIIPSEVRESLEDAVIVARGYLAHIGIREIGEAIDVSMDRSDVFAANAKAITAISDMKAIQHAMEHHTTYQEAKDAIQHAGLFDDLLGIDYFSLA